MIDVIGKIIVEIRDDADVADITTRVRGEELLKGDIPPLVLVRTMPIRRHPQLPHARHQFMILTYGKDPRQALDLMTAVSDAVHDKGPRQSAAGKAIYRSQEEVSGQYQSDPDTQWPFYSIILTVHASTEPVIAGS